MKMAEVFLDFGATVLTSLATITTAATFATSIFAGVVVVAIVPGTRQAVLSCRQRTNDQVFHFSKQLGVGCWELINAAACFEPAGDLTPTDSPES